ncbi:FKBP-type peptidyl-prolyl cis-trans isomerase [Streptomyces sp. NPDC046716]|uniref:FKBP-type peptidyl-prolyl cis-trans isomerase n=1 Tax=Streptomyces sp. NPDC046716 TaxID=3157093 RepID=UPI0033E53AAB
MPPKTAVRTGAALALTALAAVACAAQEPENVPRVTGALGTRPTITVPDQPAPEGARTTVLRDGTGPEVKKGQVAVTDVEMRSWEGGKGLVSSWGLTQPRTVRFDGGRAARSWEQALVGRRGGSRVLVVTPAASALGPQERAEGGEGVAAAGHTIAVFDLIGGYDLDQRVPVTDGGTPGAGAAGEGLPVVDLPDGAPPRVVDWGAGRPRRLHVRTVSEGRGPVVQDGDVAVVNYFGWQWGKARPFRCTYGVSGPSGMVVGRRAALPGMYEALKGVRVGSRLQIAVPADYSPGFTATPGGLAQPAHAAVLYTVDVLDRQDR